jgi:hypothetical protein
MAKYYTQTEINRLITGREAILDKVYSMADGTSYIGIKGGFLRLQGEASNTIYAPTESNSATNIQGAFDYVSYSIIKQIEINFGFDIYTTHKIFDVVDSQIKDTDKIMAQVAYVAPEGKDLDELEMDAFVFTCGAYDGGFTMLVKSLHGSVSDNYKINYSIN